MIKLRRLNYLGVILTIILAFKCNVRCEKVINTTTTPSPSSRTTPKVEPSPTAPVPVIPGLPSVVVVDNETTSVTNPDTTIDDIIAPSDICKLIVAKFASAVSNFTSCSVSNSRPIHLCAWCISSYESVKNSYHDFYVTVDEKGNPCKEYFTNLDHVEIVSSAFDYVQNLWNKGKCDYCFEKYENGSLVPHVTDDVFNFGARYELVKSCFNSHISSNETCKSCKSKYDDLNGFYIDIVAKYGENVCLDIVDTMNTTREIWSGLFHCVPPRTIQWELQVGMAIVGVIPLIFYFLSYILSSKQEAKVYHQRRLAGVFSATSASDHLDRSGFLSSPGLWSTSESAQPIDPLRDSSEPIDDNARIIT